MKKTGIVLLVAMMFVGVSLAATGTFSTKEIINSEISLNNFDDIVMDKASADTCTQTKKSCSDKTKACCDKSKKSDKDGCCSKDKSKDKSCEKSCDKSKKKPCDKKI